MADPLILASTIFSTLISLGALWCSLRQVRTTEENQGFMSRAALMAEHGERIKEIETLHGASIAHMDAQLKDTQRRLEAAELREIRAQTQAEESQKHFEACEETMRQIREQLGLPHD